MKKRILAALCACFLLFSCTLMPPASASSRGDSVYFMAVNETVLDLRSDTMPFTSGGTIYVPYVMFDPDYTGVNLGVFASNSNRTVMIYSRSGGALIFDLTTGTTTTSTGGSYSKTAVIVNSMVFLPVDVVCRHFGLTHSLIVDTDYYIVRVTSDAAAYSDADFVPRAKFIMTPRYNAYIRSLTPSGTDTPPASPNTPSRPDGGSVYLAFRCDQGGSSASLSAALERHEAFGLFFFRPEDLAARDDEIRALAAAGHRIGLILDGDGEETLSEQAALGNRLLSHILRSQTSMVLLDGADSPPEGQFAWATTADGLAGNRTSSRQVRDILRACGGSSDTFLLMDNSPRTSEILEQVLSGLEEQGCKLYLAVETVLA